MRSILPDEWDVDFTSNWLGPLDGKFISQDSLRGFGLFPWRMESDNPWWNRPLKKGEIACSISHWMCWRKALDTSHDRFLILEDDVYFVSGFQSILAHRLKQLDCHDPQWDLTYLGRFKLESDQTGTTGLVRPGYSHCTFAYALTRVGIVKMLTAGFEKNLIPVDEFLPAMYIDHPRLDVRKRFPKRLSAYAFEPPIALQLPKNLAGSDTEETDFVEWE